MPTSAELDAEFEKMFNRYEAWRSRMITAKNEMNSANHYKSKLIEIQSAADSVVEASAQAHFKIPPFTDIAERWYEFQSIADQWCAFAKDPRGSRYLKVREAFYQAMLEITKLNLQMKIFYSAHKTNFAIRPDIMRTLEEKSPEIWDASAGHALAFWHEQRHPSPKDRINVSKLGGTKLRVWVYGLSHVGEEVNDNFALVHYLISQFAQQAEPRFVPDAHILANTTIDGQQREAALSWVVSKYGTFLGLRHNENPTTNSLAHQSLRRRAIYPDL